MEEMMIAPCGMNCSLCVSYLAMQHDLNGQGFHKRYCPGCLPRGENCTFMKKNCERLGKGLVRFCFECGDFPCSRLKDLDRRYRTRYHMSMIRNLEMIRDHGMERFLSREEEAWRCPDCGGIVCCHNGLCMSCRLDLLQKDKKYHWGEKTDRSGG